MFDLRSYSSSKVHSECWSGLMLKAVTFALVFGIPLSAVDTAFLVRKANE